MEKVFIQQLPFNHPFLTDINYAERLEFAREFLQDELRIFDLKTYGFTLSICDNSMYNLYVIYEKKPPVALIVRNKLIKDEDGLPWTKVLFVRSSVGSLPEEQGMSFFQWNFQIKAEREELTRQLKEN